MLITLNGQPYEVDPPITVRGLLEKLHLQNQRLAVEVNKQVITHSKHNQFTLSQGDQVEIIQAVGGG
jgi:sulfur carrier protein